MGMPELLMLLDVFAALLAVSAAVVWLSTRGELPDEDHRPAASRRSN
jgi:cytochrome c oxidase assembly factor CtaG